MSDRDPLDELDALLSDEAPAAAFAHAVLSHGVSAVRAEPPNALTEVPAAPTDDVPAAPIKQTAHRLSGKFLAALETQFDRGELDATDVMNLLPKVHKVKIDEEKVELQRTGGRDDLPIFYVTIGSAGQIRADCKPPPHVEVVEGVEVTEPVPRGETRAPAHAWSVDFQPIDAGGES